MATLRLRRRALGKKNWPGAGKNWYRVTDTATWNEGANTVVVPGSEALIGGEWTVYGVQGRSLLLLIAK